MMAGADVATVGHFEVQETLYVQGFYRVKRARNTLTGEQCALKLLKRSKKLSEGLIQTLAPQLEREFAARSKLSHPHILPAKSFDPNAIYTTQHGSEVAVSYMETDFCPYKDFLELQAAIGGPLAESLARGFFLQLIDAVSYCHRQKVIHWNLRPESLTLDDCFRLQIRDFGSGPESRMGDSSTPPEILQGDVRSGAAVDIFCCGFILFFWCFFEPPFQRADLSNSYYRQLLSGSEKFWIRARKRNGVSESLRSLLAGMMADEPSQRLSLSEVKAHPWLLEPLLSQEAYGSQLASLLDSYSRAKSRLCRPSERLLVPNPAHVYQAWTESSSSISDFASCDSGNSVLPLPVYTNRGFCFSELFLTLSPERITSYLDEALVQIYAEVEDRSKAYKIKAKVVTDTSRLRFVVRLWDCGEGKNCVEMTLEEGEKYEFYETFRKIEKYFEERVRELQD